VATKAPSRYRLALRSFWSAGWSFFKANSEMPIPSRHRSASARGLLFTVSNRRRMIVAISHGKSNPRTGVLAGGSESGYRGDCRAATNEDLHCVRDEPVRPQRGHGNSYGSVAKLPTGSSVTSPDGHVTYCLSSRSHEHSRTQGRPGRPQRHGGPFPPQRGPSWRSWRLLRSWFGMRTVVFVQA
jgi:hypothetical protein